MSQTGKRDASQAFGSDAVVDKAGKAKKRTRRRHSDKHAVKQDDSILEDATPLASKPQGAEINFQKSSSPIKGKSATGKDSAGSEPLAPASPLPSASSPQNASPDKSVKRKRTKRGHAPVFGDTKSHIEHVLAQAAVSPNAEEGDDTSTEQTELQIASAQDGSASEEANESQLHNGKGRKRSKRKAANREEAQSKRNDAQGQVLVANTNSNHEAQQRSDQQPNGQALVKKSRKDKHVTRHTREWNLSEPSGGTFINHDPIISPDQSRLILATRHNIQIYATATSLLVRTINVSHKSEIWSYGLVREQPDSLIVGRSDGTLIKYDITTGRKIWSRDYRGGITAITSTSATDTDEAYLMVTKNPDATFQMSTVVFDSNGKQTGRKTLLSQKTLIKPQISFSAELGIAVVCSKHTIMVGKLSDEPQDESAAMKWHDIPVVGGSVICFDALIRPASQSNKKASSEARVDVAVGLGSGEIHIYNDVLNYSGQRISARKLHWHRSAPRTVKFSPTTDYLISGGDETVLVIWQLDTNQKQTLPHLTASILNTTVFHDGSAYVLRMADNSVMIISTSDLKASANVSNLIIDASSRAPFLPGLKVPAALHPEHDDRLLLAYSLQSLNDHIKPSEKSSTMLQTFDVAATLQLSRQALTRNLVSSVNIDMQGKPLAEPDVTHFSISHDGRWLVSVDQWTPNNSDAEAMYLGRGDQKDRAQSTESHVRFWSTTSTEGTDMWELNTRIDSPVAINLSSKRRAILAIAANPARLQVAVADTNRCLKIYSPKARMRSGVPTTDANGQQLYTWACDHELFFDETAPSVEPEHATLSFSQDGSVLAVAWSSSSHLKARVHLVDSKLGTKAASLPGIVSHGCAHIAWYGKYLLGLSDKFCIYDTVKMEETFCLQLDKSYDHSKSLMAVNHLSGAVAICVAERSVRAQSYFVLLDIKAGYTKTPLLDQKVPSQIPVLLAEKTRGGFLIVDGEGRTVKISPPRSSEYTLALKDLPEKKPISNTLDNVFGKAQKVIQAPVQQPTSSRSLEDIFKIESSAAAPAPKDLFNQVALVLAGSA